MSLICGILSRSDPQLASAENLEAMLKPVSHRARHGRETFIDPADGVALAYCHTATFGQSKDVPSWHEDETVVAAVDGDIYDAATGSRGRQPSIKSPHARSIVANFERNATTFPAGLDGIFSLFLWDRRQKTLYLSTDPMGHKLVYEYEDVERNLLVFSTELKAVLAHPSVPRQLDETALPIYLSFGAMLAPFTLVKGVRKIRPAECISFAPNQTKSTRFWRPTLEDGPNDFDYWVERTRSELKEAVRRTVGNAQSVGVYLSGGVDSSAILAALTESRGVDSQAFTLAYRGARSQSDIEWAERIARATGTHQQTIFVDPNADVTPELLSTLFRQIDEPFDSAGRMVSDYLLGKAGLEAGFESMLNGGAGGDLFAFRHARQGAEESTSFESLDQALATRLKGNYFKGERMSRALAHPPETTLLDEAPLANRELLEDLDQVQAPAFGRIVLRSASRNSLFYQYMPPLLGLDERSPYLDARLASFAVSVPAKFKGIDSKAFDKALLKECYLDVLQVDFNQREHEAFPSAPIPDWLNRILVPSLKLLADDGIVTRSYLRWLDKNILQGRRRASSEAWQLFVFNCWYQFQIKQTDPFASVA